MSPEELVRDGTIVGPKSLEIDLRSKDRKLWVTVKADNTNEGNRRAEALAAWLEAENP